MAAIDTSIYGQLQPFQVESPVNALAKIATYKNAENQNRLFDMKVAESDRAQQVDQATRAAYALDDPTARSNALRTADPKAYREDQTFQVSQQKAQRDAEKAGLETAIQKQGIVAQYAGSAKDQASWTAAKQALAGMGIDVSQVPDQYDPNTAQTLLQRSLTGAQQLEQQWKAKGYDLDVAKFGETVRNNKTQNSISAANLGVAQAGLGLRKQELEQKKTNDKETLKQNAASTAKVNDAKDVLGLLDEIDTILPKATNGLIGVARDTAAGGFGYSTEGANATAQLKALQGSLVSKMPKMSGPQSDKDVQLYREMAGQVGDPMVPRAQRQAASKTIRKLNEKYAGMEEGSSIKGNSTKIDSLLDKYK